MKSGGPDFQIKVSAKDDGTFGSTIRKVKADLAEISKQLASQVTGGIIGGGTVSAVMGILDKTLTVIQETGKLLTRAQGLNLPAKMARGITANAKLMGADPNDVLTGMETLDKRRIDAIAGDEAAIESFRRLGISIKEIKDLKPDELFFKVGNRLQGALNVNKRLALNDLFGSVGNSLIPYFSKNGGDQFRPNKRQLALDGWVGFAGANVPWMTDWILGARAFKNGNPYTVGVDDVSTIPNERQQMASKLATQNRERSIDLVRSQLPLEQQLTLALSERLKIERQLSSVKDPVKRERLVARLLDLDATILGARNAQMNAQTAPTGATWSRNLDDLSRAGIFTGGSPSLFIDLAKQQLGEARKQTALLQSNPEQIAKSL